MILERLRGLLLPFIVASAGLFLGLAPGVLETGQVRPLDWLLPAGAVLALLCFTARDRLKGRRMAVCWALVALPPLLLCLRAGTRMAWGEALAFAGLLALAAGVFRWTMARGHRAAMIAALLALGILGGVQAVATLRGGGWRGAAPGDPALGIMSALPLFRDHGAEAGLLNVGGQAPLLRALPFASVPLDRLDAGALERVESLLLVQPRLLRPEELVALDAWVRAGGHAVILADPLLRWPDPRPIGDPGRAPLTSLLDPLLTHWGLALEPAHADAGPVTRHVLDDGTLLQLAGASRFTRLPGSSCMLAAGGLRADCGIGRGRAILVADADWADDRLWTLDPARPDYVRGWTSDAVPLLTALLRATPLTSGRNWLVSQEALVAALRWALALILLLGLLLPRTARNPNSTHDPPGSDGCGTANDAGCSPDPGQRNPA